VFLRAASAKQMVDPHIHAIKSCKKDAHKYDPDLAHPTFVSNGGVLQTNKAICAIASFGW
jgi:hypothetical protein